MAKFLNPFKSYTLDDIPDYIIDHESMRKLRSDTRILIIDDKEFDKKAGLTAMGYNITLKRQWEDIKDVEPYHIIVSDNKGVAERIGEKVEGAFLLNQVVKLYPEKTCILFSESALDFGKAKLLEGTKQIKKDDDIKEWSEVLSETIVDIYNPKTLWFKVEKILQSQHVSRKITRKIEDKFVRSVILKKDASEKWYNTKWPISDTTIKFITSLFLLAVRLYRI